MNDRNSRAAAFLIIVAMIAQLIWLAYQDARLKAIEQPAPQIRET